jgi:hypothetical protein
VKFIVFFEWDPESYDNVLAKGKEWVQELKAHPEKYGKWVRLQDGTAISFGMIGRSKGFAVREVDNEEQMNNAVLFWRPVLKLTYVPIIQAAAAREGRY